MYKVDLNWDWIIYNINARLANEWCLSQFGSRRDRDTNKWKWYSRDVWDDSDYTWKTKFYFQKEEDASWFTLRWAHEKDSDWF